MRNGRVTPEQAARMAANLSEEDRETLRLLTDYPEPVHAGAPQPDTEPVDPQFAALWPPQNGVEAERRAKLAAAARRAWSDDEVFTALYGRQP